MVGLSFIRREILEKSDFEKSDFENRDFEKSSKNSQKVKRLKENFFGKSLSKLVLRPLKAFFSGTELHWTLRLKIAKFCQKVNETITF